MAKLSKYVGLDAHKQKINVAVAAEGREEPRDWGEIDNRPEAIRKLLGRLSPNGERLRLCYEAGPCGYELYRQIVAAGHDCAVVAPSLIPTKPGADQDQPPRLPEPGAAGSRRRAGSAARPQPRPRGPEDRRQATAPEAERISAAARTGLRGPQALDAAVLAPAREAAFRVSLSADRARRIRRGGAAGATALRGVDRLAAVTLLAELDDLSRFARPSELMSYVGLVPSEHSSGEQRRQGGVTETGNAHARRMLIECAWAYRFPARKTATIQRRAERTPAVVQAISWKAQKRLCGRFQRLRARGVSAHKAVTAIARELCGFLWAVVCEVQRPKMFPASA